MSEAGAQHHTTLSSKFHASTPFVSWASFLAVLGIVVTALTGNLNLHAETTGVGVPPVTVQQISNIEAELQDHAQKLADDRADVEGLKHDAANYQADMADLRTQLGKLNDKTDRQLELTMRMMQTLQASQGGRR